MVNHRNARRETETMASYTVELLDTETDEVVDVLTITAATDKDADRIAEEEAAYHGFHAGTVRRLA
jgi:phosphoribosyl-ATP pyrophosphohydrolase